jgi:transposase
MFNRLKSRVSLAPLFVKRDDQRPGLTSLLTLGVRVFPVLEFVRRRALDHEQAPLPGLHPEKRKKMTDTPTAERFLKALSDVSLTIMKTAAGEDIRQRLTPLSAVQQDILQRLGLDTSLSQQLAMHDTGK